MRTPRWGRVRSVLAGLGLSLVALAACEDDEPHLNPRPEEDPSNDSPGEPTGNSGGVGGSGNAISDPNGGNDGAESPVLPDAGLPAPDAGPPDGGPPDGGAGDCGSGGADGVAAESDE